LRPRPAAHPPTLPLPGLSSMSISAFFGFGETSPAKDEAKGSKSEPAPRVTPEKRTSSEANGTPVKRFKHGEDEGEGLVGRTARVKQSVERKGAKKSAGCGGQVLQHHPKATDIMCLKIRFEDGKRPDDWFRSDEVEVSPSLGRVDEMRSRTEKELKALVGELKEDFEEYRGRLEKFAGAKTVMDVTKFFLGFVPGGHLVGAGHDAAVIADLQVAVKETANAGTALMAAWDFRTASRADSENENKLLHLLARQTKVMGEDMVSKKAGVAGKQGEPGVRFLRNYIRARALNERLQTLDALCSAS